MHAAAPTRVVLDATCLTGAAGMRGVGRYVRGLLEALAVRPELDLYALVSGPTTLPERIAARPVRRRAPGRLAPYERDLLLPLSLSDADVAHVPVPEPARWSRLPVVQTLLDTIPLTFEAAGREARRWRWYARRYRAADAVVAISRASADAGLAQLGLDARRVHVAHPGVDPIFRSPGVPEPADPPYLLMVAEYAPHKGFPEAFAVARAIADAGLPHRLVVAGRIAPWTEAEVRGLRTASGRPDRIELAGFVPDLPTLYAGATAVLVTSRHEGFGYPAAEAMAGGVPVVAFDSSSLPEVVGDGGTLVRDGDVPAFAAALRPLLVDPGVRQERAEAAWQRGGQFGWTATVDLCASLYREVAT